MLRRPTPAWLAAVLLAALPAGSFAEPIVLKNTPFEIAVTAVSDRTVRISLVPLTAEGMPVGDPPSAVLTDAARANANSRRIRDLGAGESVALGGGLQVTVSRSPLTIRLEKLGVDAMGTPRRLVQQITVNSDDGSLVINTPSPTFGLGQGRQQYDRRGFFYNFVNGQNDYLGTHSSTIPVPFLIGTDALVAAGARATAQRAWAMFLHNPPPTPPRDLSNAQRTAYANTPWAVFDLRGENAGPPPAVARGGGGNRARGTTNPAAAPGGGGSTLESLLVPPDPLPTKGRIIPRQDTFTVSPTHIFLSALDSPADAMGEFVTLTGKPAMPPRWAMGYMQSHRSLAGPEEVLSVVKTFREKQLPCDAVIYLGTGYTNATASGYAFGGWNTGHGSLEFNPATFTTNPQGMIDQIHALNFKIVWHKNAAPTHLYGASVHETPADPNDRLHIANYWNTHVPLLKMGTDGWWPDDGDQLPVESRLARHRLYYEGSLRDKPNERPWTLNRNGYASAARYGAWIWSGDVQSRWVTLANHVPIGLNYSMSVTPFWGSDTGGFYFGSTPEYTGELYTRWFQFSAFNPLFRSHGRNWHLHLPWGWNLGTIPTRESGNSPAYPADDELRNAAVEPICRHFLELRYRLLPYNYTITREACDTGMPPMRAHALTDPGDPEAVKLGTQYMWGPSMLVAPVVEKGATLRRVYLPKGTWYDWWTGERQYAARGTVSPAQIRGLEGGVLGAAPAGAYVERKVDLATMPLFVKAGSIIPLDPVRQYTGQAVTEPTTLRVYPGADGSFTLYDDDGHTMAYAGTADPAAQWIKCSWQDATRTFTVEADPRMQVPAGFSRPFTVELVGAAGTKRVEFRGERVALTF